MKEFPERLKMLKGDMNVSQFARFLGVKQQTLDNYLKNKRKPNIPFVLTVCAKCCKSSDWVLGLVDNKGRDVVQRSVVNNEPSKSPYPCVECSKKDRVIETLVNSNKILVEKLGKVHCQPEITRGGEANRKGA